MMTVIYMVIAGIALDALRLYFIPEGGILNDGYKVISFLGIWIIAFMMTFNFFWQEAGSHGITSCFKEHPSMGLPVIFGALLLFLLWLKLVRKLQACAK
jgi:hypothetical protein